MAISVRTLDGTMIRHASLPECGECGASNSSSSSSSVETWSVIKEEDGALSILSGGVFVAQYAPGMWMSWESDPVQ
jgi:hypothetical protein